MAVERMLDAESGPWEHLGPLCLMLAKAALEQLKPAAKPTGTRTLAEDTWGAGLITTLDQRRCVSERRDEKPSLRRRCRGISPRIPAELGQ